MTTAISDLIVPSIFAGYVQEQSSAVNKIVTSGVVVADSVMGSKIALASGNNFHLPSMKNVSESSASYAVPTDVAANIATADKIAARKQIVPVLDRNFTWGAADLASSFAGADPMLSAAMQAGEKQVIERQKLLLKVLAGVLSASSMSSHVNDVSIADGNAATGSNKISATEVIDTTAAFGDMYQTGGFICMHSTVYRNLQIQNLITYVPTNVQNIGWGTYLGMTVLVDDTCPKVAGGTSGFKYTSYLCAPGSIGFAAGSPRVPVEVSREALQGNGGGFEYLTIRDKLSFHVYGTSFTGTPADDVITDAELATGSNWTAVYNTKLIGVAALVTNG